VSGGPVLWSDTNAGSDPIRLSSDDTLIAVSNDSGPGAPAATTIYRNGKFFSAAPGWAVTWLTNNDLLANAVPNQKNSVIYNSSGILQQTTPLPAVGTGFPVQVLGADSLYDPSSNRIYAISTGAVAWSTTTEGWGIGAVAGSNVVFVANGQVVMQPY
jgi:hypothetical protein